MGEQLRAVVKSEGVSWTFEDEAGTQRARLVGTYQDAWAGVVARLPMKGSGHEEFPGMVLVKRKVDREPGLLATVTLTYESNDPSAQYGPDGAAGEVRRYDMEIVQREEPLLTHDRYSGLAEAELEALARIMNGERKTEEGVDLVGLVTSSEGMDALTKIRRGQTSYLDFGLEWVERSVIQVEDLTAEIELAKINKIDVPPGGAPTDALFDWLYLGGPGRSRDDGVWMDLEKRWRMSGLGGWGDLYEEPAP